MDRRSAFSVLFRAHWFDSDTIRSIDVDPKWEHTINDIEAVDSEGTNRCFSDGVGKFSQGLLDKIYHQSESIEATRSTVFQIRYGRLLAHDLHMNQHTDGH